MKKWFEYTRARTSKDIYDKLPKHEKDLIEQYRKIKLVSASDGRTKEAIREILRFREITQKDITKIDLNDLCHFLVQLKNSSFGDHTKNKIKAFIHHFLKKTYTDWVVRFSEFEEIRYNDTAKSKKKITEKDIITPEERDKILKEEDRLPYKTFFMVQLNGGLRTIEVRNLKWDQITFEEDKGYCYLTITSKKNPKANEKEREVILKEATHYLILLRKQQKELGINTPYVFPSPRDPLKPISKYVNNWFKDLTKKAIGREVTNYIACRHTKGTKLKKLVREGKMSKENAITFMGHSEKMFDKVYDHMDKEDIREIMKKQLYDFDEMPKEKKDKLEQEVEDLKKSINKVQKENKYFSYTMKAFVDLHSGKIDKKEFVRTLKAIPVAIKLENE